MAWSTIVGRVVSGHGVASGKANDPRFPDGTLAMQKPFFLKLGLDLGRFHEGTLNVSIQPRSFCIRQAAFTFRNVKWSEDLSAEDFSFCECKVSKGRKERLVEGLVYYPHPETKPEFFQDPSTLEILAPFLTGITHDSEIYLQLLDQQTGLL